MHKSSHPLDGEEVLYSVTAIHQQTSLTGSGADQDIDKALTKAKDNLLELLEQVGGG